MGFFIAPPPEDEPMNDKRIPRAWTEQKIRDLISDYDAQLDRQKLGSGENARKREGITMIAVPNPLVDKVRALIAREHRA